MTAEGQRGIVRLKHISFSQTEPQIRAKTKTVTRRDGWRFLKPGTLLQACRKIRGLQPGEKRVRLKVIEVTNVRRERLDRMLQDPAYGKTEVRKEGFPHLTPEEFVAMFCQTHKGCQPSTTVTRIEFRYVDGLKR
jgi:hypothetical protein